MTLGGRPAVGWREWAYLPELDIGPIKAKVDTGARTSALHAYDIAIDGDVVEFSVHTIQGRNDFSITARAPLVDERLVRDSGGKTTLRPIIRTTLKLGGKAFSAEVSLVDRQEMYFRMLIGRVVLAEHFDVDCSQEYVGGIPDVVRNWRKP